MSHINKPSSLFFTGLAAVILGYVSLRTPPVDSFWSMTLAPLLLILGYLWLIPAGLWPRSSPAEQKGHNAISPDVTLATRIAGPGVFGFSFVVYLLTMWPGPRWWDSAGYVVSSVTMGVDGAPGSLLLQLLGRLVWFVAFIVTPSARLNLLSALVTAVAVTILFYVMLRLLRSVYSNDDRDDTAVVIGALTASLTLAFAVSVWAHSGYANPYGLSMLAAAILLYLAVRWWENPDAEGASNFLLLAAFVFGLDLSIHRSNLLFVPGFVLLVLVRKPRLILSGRLWIGGIMLFGLGLSLQLTNMFRAQLDPRINFTDPDNLGKLWDYLALKERGISVFGADLLQRKGPLWATQIKHEYLRYLGWNFAGFDPENMTIKWDALYGLPLLVGILGLLYSFIRRKATSLLLILFLCSSALAIFYLNIPPDYFRKMDRHFLASFMIFAVWIGFGSCALMRFLTRITGYRPAVDWMIGLLLFVVLPINALYANWKTNDQSGNFTPIDFGKNILDSCEKDAILITGGDSDTFPVWYLQMVEGYRPDVLTLNYSLLNTSWRLKSHLKYHPSIPWNLTSETIDSLVPIAADSEVVTIYTTGPDSIPVHLKVVPSIEGRYRSVSDQVLLDILKTNRWRRPIYLSAGLGPIISLGLQEYMRPDGVVFKIAVRKNERADISALERNLLERYSYRGMGGEVRLDKVSRAMTRNYLNAFGYLERYYAMKKDNTALERLNKLRDQLWPGEQ